MQNPGNNFEEKLLAITSSNAIANDKMMALNELIAGLNALHHGKEICRASEIAAVIAEKANRAEMAAQFCLMRAKAEIAAGGELIAEMKDLKMAIEWFEFALETEKERYRDLNTKLQAIWQKTQAAINLGYKLLNKKPYVGAVAFCHHTAGEIYGSHYLQLKLYYFEPGRPWKARIGNLVLARWLGIDDLFIIDKKSRTHLRVVKKDCLKAIHQAIPLFRSEKAYTYFIECYLDLSLEHHSFNNPVRSKLYLWWGWFLMKWYKVNEPRFQERFVSLRAMPLIGSDRDKNPL